MKFCVGDGFPDVPIISRNLWEGRLGSRPLQNVKERFIYKLIYYNFDEPLKPPSDEGGGKTVGFDGGRENAYVIVSS
ncbi:MAG TPA: hypothetical protein DD413_02040 [Ruminococcus sp.]|nr:hypothetical protein [Ruminococcus sp.]